MRLFGGGGGRTFNAEAPPTALNIITTAQHTRRVERRCNDYGEDVTYLFHLSCTLPKKKGVLGGGTCIKSGTKSVIQNN